MVISRELNDVYLLKTLRLKLSPVIIVTKILFLHFPPFFFSFSFSSLEVSEPEKREILILRWKFRRRRCESLL